MKHMIKMVLGIAVMVLVVFHFQQRLFSIKFEAFKQHRVITTSGRKRERTPSVTFPGQFSLNNLKIQNLPFISSLKNPCWFEEQSKINRYTLNCLPYGFLVGQPKSATTDLYRQLIKHPDISPATTKEPQWWSRERFTIRGTWNNYVRKFILSSYLQNECGLNEPSKASNISFRCKKRITLDASPSTFWDMGKTMRELKDLETHRQSPKGSQLLQLLESSQLKSRNENDFDWNSVYFKYTLADLIHLQLPESRIIVIFRNPVDRLYSGYRFLNKKEQKSTVKFDNEVRQTLKVWNDCLKRNSHRFCIYDPITTSSMKLRLHVSIYVTFVEDWLKVFPQDQFLFIRTEDYKENEAETLSQICDHLGLNPFPINSTQKRRKLVNLTKIQLRPMLNKTRQVLTEFFAPLNRQLAQLLEDDRFLWKDSLNHS